MRDCLKTLTDAQLTEDAYFGTREDAYRVAQERARRRMERDEAACRSEDRRKEARL